MSKKLHSALPAQLPTSCTRLHLADGSNPAVQAKLAWAKEQREEDQPTVPSTIAVCAALCNTVSMQHSGCEGHAQAQNRPAECTSGRLHALDKPRGRTVTHQLGVPLCCCEGELPHTAPGTEHPRKLPPPHAFACRRANFPLLPGPRIPLA